MTQSVLGAAGPSGDRGERPPRLPIVTLGISLSAFLALSFVLCILLGLVVPGWGLHQPWLQFYPGFVWLTPGNVPLSLVENVVYAWYAALVFGRVVQPRRRPNSERMGPMTTGSPRAPGSGT